MKRSVVALILLALAIVSPAGAEFRFTATVDPRMKDDAFAAVLDAINARVGGPGAFHVTCGDNDPPAPLRAKIDSRFGPSAVWVPVVGNHDAESKSVMRWLRAEYDSANGSQARRPISAMVGRPGPGACRQTTYSWDHGDAHFIVLNQYWDGRNDDTAADGDIAPALLEWLAADLAANTRPLVFVFGHEPAFPQGRHVGGSLDKYRGRRDAFWALLAKHQVAAYITGHTHSFSRVQRDGVWQVDLGNAGLDGGDGKTFLDVTVAAGTARLDVWRDKGGWRKAASWTVQRR
jgi:hypothetical protein